MAKESCNVLAVYSLLYSACREHFSGVLEEMSNTSNWRLTAIPPEWFAARGKLANEIGEPFDGIILSMPGDRETMGRVAESRIPTVLVDITDRRVTARRDAVSTVWTDNADVGRRETCDGSLRGRRHRVFAAACGAALQAGRRNDNPQGDSGCEDGRSQAAPERGKREEHRPRDAFRFAEPALPDVQKAFRRDYPRRQKIPRGR